MPCLLYCCVVEYQDDEAKVAVSGIRQHRPGRLTSRVLAPLPDALGPPFYLPVGYQQLLPVYGVNSIKAKTEESPPSSAYSWLMAAVSDSVKRGPQAPVIPSQGRIPEHLSLVSMPYSHATLRSEVTADGQGW